MRLFAGIPIPDKLADFLNGQNWPDGIRVVPSGNLHITLAFIGETPPEKLVNVKSALGELRFNVFDANATGFGAFPGLNNPLVVWVGIEPVKPFVELHKSCAKKLANSGYKSPSRPFVPHITIGRNKNCPADKVKKALAGNPSPEGFTIPVTKINLYESRFVNRGVEYRILDSVSGENQV